MAMTIVIVGFLVVLDGHEGERVLLSYDISGAARATAARVCQIVFGRTRQDARGRTRTQVGFVHRPGVVWIGQSVFVLPPGDAEELAARLRTLGVRVATGTVSIARASLEGFHRPS